MIMKMKTKTKNMMNLTLVIKMTFDESDLKTEISKASYDVISRNQITGTTYIQFSTPPKTNTT